jgi:mRNA-degrading endonuclease RelE of RelBE toxin-antitoxin system
MAKRRDQSAARTVEQSARFAKAKRRLHAKAQLTLDDHVKKILENSMVGEPKTGALLGVRVVKFKIDRQQLLLAYEFNERRNVIELLDVGAHENFYRDLTQYLDDR